MKISLGIRAAVMEGKELHDQWIGGGDSIDPCPRAIKFRVRKEIRQVQEEYDKQLAAQKESRSYPNHIPDGLTLFSPPLFQLMATNCTSNGQYKFTSLKFLIPIDLIASSRSTQCLKKDNTLPVRRKSLARLPFCTQTYPLLVLLTIVCSVVAGCPTSLCST